MPEILTESFCERCGTRYTFESAAPKVKLKGLKVMSRGLRNFVLSDDSSMDEAMAAARNETDREQTTQQLDAFHKTFNFCMNCRQYTCGNCWNEAEGRCLSCAPSLGQEVMPAPFGNMGAGGAMTLSDSEAIGLHEHNGHDAAAPTASPMAWPTSDLMREADVADAPPWTEASTEPAWAQAPVEPEVAPEIESVLAEEAEVQWAEATLSEEAAPAEEAVRPEEPAAVADDFEPFDFAARLEAVSGPLAAAEPAVDEAISEPEPVEPEPAPRPPTLEQRAQVYLRIGLDEAVKQLGGPVHVIEGMTPELIGLTRTQLIPGSGSARPVVRGVYVDARGRLILLDQQRVASGQAPSSPTGSLRWTIGDVMLYLRGEPSPDVLRSLQARVR